MLNSRVKPTNVSVWMDCHIHAWATLRLRLVDDAALGVVPQVITSWMYANEWDPLRIDADRYQPGRKPFAGTASPCFTLNRPVLQVVQRRRAVMHWRGVALWHGHPRDCVVLRARMLPKNA